MGGTVFRITPSGTLTTLYTFCSQIGCAELKRKLHDVVRRAREQLAAKPAEPDKATGK